MMRKLAMAMVVSGALGSSFANALGLGELKLNSSLNEPLDAEVKLLSVGGLSKNEILPNLGSHDDFSRAGVERVFFLTSIKFDVQLDAEGGAVIRLTTDRIVREPFLDFLIEIHWPNGRLLREYTTFLDPPLFAETPVAAVRQAVTQSPKPKEPAPKPKEPAPKPTASKVARAESYGASASKASSGQVNTAQGTVLVKKNDTLWDIARDNRPDNSVTVRQTMLAIQDQNPQAFIRNNINLLKSGQVLRIPGVEEILRVSSHEAYLETARQNDEWSNKQTIDAGQSVANKTGRAGSTVPGTDDSGMLKLVAAENELVDEVAEEGLSSAAPSESALSASDGASSQLEGEAGEQAGSLTNVESLKSELDNLQRLVTLKQQQLALLQTSLAEQQSENEAVSPTAEQALDTGVIDNKGLSNEEVDSAEQPASTLLTESSDSVVQEINQTAAIKEDKPVAVEQPVAAEQPAEQSILSLLIDNPLYIGGGIVAILGGLIALGAISRRRKETQDYPEDLHSVFAAADHDIRLAGDPQQASSTAGNGDEVELFDAPDNTLSEAGQQQLESADKTRKLLEEADIYIAYGRYERAIDILQPAVNTDPGNTALRLKLAEMFLVTGNQAEFDLQAVDLQAIGDAAALEKLAELQSKHSDEAPSSPQALTDKEPLGEQQTTEQSLDSVSEEVFAELEDLELADIEFELPETDTDQLTERSETSAEADNNLQAENLHADTDESTNSNLVEFIMDDAADPQQGDSASQETEDMGFLVDTDESATKLDLAKAYIDMMDEDAAQEILKEVVSEGSEMQKEEARNLLEKLG